jgi:hypothetical protein
MGIGNPESFHGSTTGGQHRIPSEGSNATPLPPFLTKEEQDVQADYEWCLHDPEVRRLHGGQVVAVHQRHVWGAGPNHATARDAALQQPGCPAITLTFVWVPFLPPGPESNLPSDQ